MVAAMNQSTAANRGGQLELPYGDTCIIKRIEVWLNYFSRYQK